MEVLGLRVLVLGEWRRQLLVQVFRSDARLAPGELRDTITSWVAANRCDPRCVKPRPRGQAEAKGGA